MTAGIVNLVPEGLILLISVTAAVSAFKMAERGVLAQQLNAIESLASVEIVCTDKTGTLTEPTLWVVTVVPARGEHETSLGRELASYAASAPSRNLTLEAIARAELADVHRRGVVAQVPFSSRSRWSALGSVMRSWCSARRSALPTRTRPWRSGPAQRRPLDGECSRSVAPDRLCPRARAALPS